jgi:hypothetical protein
MILKIDFNPDDVIYQKNGRILLKVKYYAQYSVACHLATTEGSTKEEFEKHCARANKSVYVGSKGGLSLD